jgi:hypothetical protein
LEFQDIGQQFVTQGNRGDRFDVGRTLFAIRRQVAFEVATLSETGTATWTNVEPFAASSFAQDYQKTRRSPRDLHNIQIYTLTLALPKARKVWACRKDTIGTPMRFLGFFTTSDKSKLRFDVLMHNHLVATFFKSGRTFAWVIECSIKARMNGTPGIPPTSPFFLNNPL